MLQLTAILLNFEHLEHHNSLNVFCNCNFLSKKGLLNRLYVFSSQVVTYKAANKTRDLWYKTFSGANLLSRIIGYFTWRHDSQHNDTQLNVTQHLATQYLALCLMTLSIMTLTILTLIIAALSITSRSIKCLSVECHHYRCNIFTFIAECHSLECCYAKSDGALSFYTCILVQFFHDLNSLANNRLGNKFNALAYFIKPWITTPKASTINILL